MTSVMHAVIGWRSDSFNIYLELIRNAHRVPRRGERFGESATSGTPVWGHMLYATQGDCMIIDDLSIGTVVERQCSR